ncbi:MAG TPA: DUF427 domain-containing protein [Sporichthyaceae bacterium]|jgi:uncharacterized protein (DUF427 family)|nr:DUF427 domain-containing protein [Sporichthyaceae bacterium]
MEQAGQRGRVRVETSRKRVRAVLGGEVIADAHAPRLVWEVPYYPTYYFPVPDIRVPLVANGVTERSPSRGVGQRFDIKAAGTTASGAALRYPDSPIEELRDLVRLDWPAMDEWFEEDEPIYVHPRDPYTRVDVLASSRHVRIEVDGVVVARSTQPRILFETGLPPRYYLPLTDLRMDLLRPSELQTQCPYKGTAGYWSLQIGGRSYPDLVWTYRTPLPESQKIAGLACFYNEKVDLYLDGQLQDRPRTHFS